MTVLALNAVVSCVGGLAALRYGLGLRSSDPYRGTWCAASPNSSGYVHCGGIPHGQLFVVIGGTLIVLTLLSLVLVVLELVGRPLDSSQPARTMGKDV